MIFKRLEFGLLVRFVLLFGMMFLTLHYLAQFTWLQVATGCAIMLAQVWELARYVTRSNNELARFLQAVAQRDFSQQFNQEQTNHSLRRLHQAFNQLNQTFRQLHIEKQGQLLYMQTILQLIDTGIISFTETGEVEWVNDAFKKMLGLPHLRNLKSLEMRYPELYLQIKELPQNESKLIKIKLPQGPGQLLLSATTFTMQEQKVKLVALKNVSSAVDETESEAWQKLLRVMTHEIMNSVAPIASLADTLEKHLHQELELYQENQQYPPNHELLQDTEEGIAIIKKRSEGLLRFAHFYRNLNKPQHLLLTTVYVQELFNSIYRLMHPRLSSEGISLQCQTAEDITLQGDVNLLEQVLINLVLNAAHAVKGKADAQILLVARKQENGKVVIEVRDNGSGIPEELLDSIFIPFFTSHKEGTGIGLSLARHIMFLHKGRIQVSSAVGSGSVFSLVF